MSLLASPWQTKLHSSAARSSDAEETIESLEDDNRSLKSQLEESKRAASRLTKERDELSRRLEERDLEREALRRGKTDLEEQKRLLDRALEKMTKEVADSLFIFLFSRCTRGSALSVAASPSDGGHDGRVQAVGGGAADAAGRLQGALQEGPAGGPAHQQGAAGRAAEAAEQPEGPAGGGERRADGG